MGYCRRTSHRNSPKEVSTMDFRQKAEEFLEDWSAEEAQQKVKIALFGQPGSGKSSLINELIGEKVAAVSTTTDTTKQAQIVEHQGAVFVDLPGYDTSEFPANEYFSAFHPLQYDIFVCVFSNKLHEADTVFFRRLQAENRVCLFVRNKSDGIYDAGKTLAQSQAEIQADVAAQIGVAVPVLFTSCRTDKSAQERGIAQLEEAIAARLDPALKDRFIRSVKAYTMNVLNQKKAESRKYINDAMVKGAINGLNPIVGVDVTIDVEIMRRMYAHIRETFGITEEELNSSKIKDKLVDLIMRGIKKDTIILGLRKVMTENMQKRLAKYLPYVGQAASMGLGAAMMYYLGYEYVDACYTFAQGRLMYEIGKGKA